MGRWEPFEQHLFLIPDAKLLVFIPASNDKLVLQRVDIEKLLDKADVDYLYVQSQPLLNFKAGTDYKYQIVTRSRKGGVKYKLESGPDKMTLSPDGLLSWKVPADFAEAEVNIIITVSDKTGQEIFHTFRRDLAGACGERTGASKGEKATRGERAAAAEGSGRHP